MAVHQRIGGFASGTIAGSLARRLPRSPRGSLAPPLGRTLVATKLRGGGELRRRYVGSSSNRWQSESSRRRSTASSSASVRDGDVPIWTYACADALLEEARVDGAGSEHQTSSTGLLGVEPAGHVIKALVNYRD